MTPALGVANYARTKIIRSCAHGAFREAHTRSFAKAVTWRLTGSLDTFILSFIITGSFKFAGGIAATELITKIVPLLPARTRLGARALGRQVEHVLAAQSAAAIGGEIVNHFGLSSRVGESMPEHDAILVTAAPGLRQAALDWAEHLGQERRLSAKTLEAYGRDLEQFLRFLTGHLGEPPSPAAISELRPADIRAFMAHRRADGAGARTLGRQIAALRSFARFCERRGIAATTAFTSVRPPKQPKSLPKALSIGDSAALMETRGALSEEPWIAARDTAVLMLLYGCGLRISEALGLTRGDAPIGAIDAIRVVGKGGRERIVPVLPAVRRAVEAYIDLVPFPLEPDMPLFRGARGGPLSPRIVQLAIGAASRRARA